ncbi:MFS transporter [Nocardia crassostreae]|uniref:MFS transporter n=1 Tax=Nocardia crassostreae TaxID=53428 RepID=UPI001FE06942|nr:MFS transporter [Nocardia crassostreae]
MAGLAIFTVASLACGLAWNAPALIVFRFLQGIGSAAMVPQVMTIIQRTFTGATRARAISAYAAVTSGAMVIGQIAGGLIVSADLFGTGWRGVFLVNVPIGLALLVMAPRLLPVTARVERKLDLAGLAVLTSSVLLLVVPLVLGHEQDWPLWSLLALGGAAVGFGVFAVVERRVHRRGGEPLFSDRVLRAPGLVLSAITLFLVMCTVGGSLFVMAIHLQSTLGYSALHAGLLFLPNGIAFAVASVNWQRVPARFHAAAVPAGLALAALSMASMGLLLRDGSEPGVSALVVFAVQGAGLGLGFGPLVARATSRVPVAVAADASGILVTGTQLGVVVGIASFGSLFLSLAGTTTLSASHAFAVTGLATGAIALVAAVLAVRAAR